MKTTAIYIRLSEAGQPIALTTMDIKVLLLRAGGITIKGLAEDEDMKCSRVALVTAPRPKRTELLSV